LEINIFLYNLVEIQATGYIHILHTKYYSGDHSRKMRWLEHVASTGDRRDAYTFLVGRPKGKILLGRPWCRW
jgi:hypothetical protein